MEERRNARLEPRKECGRLASGSPARGSPRVLRDAGSTVGLAVPACRFRNGGTGRLGGERATSLVSGRGFSAAFVIRRCADRRLSSPTVVQSLGGDQARTRDRGEGERRQPCEVTCGSSRMLLSARYFGRIKQLPVPLIGRCHGGPNRPRRRPGVIGHVLPIVRAGTSA